MLGSHLIEECYGITGTGGEEISDLQTLPLLQRVTTLCHYTEKNPCSSAFIRVLFPMMSIIMSTLQKGSPALLKMAKIQQAHVQKSANNGRMCDFASELPYLLSSLSYRRRSFEGRTSSNNENSQ